MGMRAIEMRGVCFATAMNLRFVWGSADVTARAYHVASGNVPCDTRLVISCASVA